MRSLFLFRVCLACLAAYSLLFPSLWGAFAREVVGPPAPVAHASWTGKAGKAWKDVDKLIEDQKMEAAVAKAEALLKQAKAERNSEEWVRSLVRLTQLRMGLHGYETAVRFLKEQPWPDDVLGRTVLNLYYAFSLSTYAQTYSWEIRKRERVDTKGVVDLKSWTNEQIGDEAERALQDIWSIREQLGEHPIVHVEEYITTNTFPEGIRPTLRDAVTYLRSAYLVDTSFWSPSQENEVYRLNLQELLKGPKLPSRESAEAHPLEIAVAVLFDLESWHTKRNEKEAALEARLERFRRLHASFTTAADRAMIRETLSKGLESFRDVSWWAEGMAQVAEFTLVAADGDARILAHKIAAEGVAAFGKTQGGKHCLSIVKRIEKPEFTVSSMSHDGAGRPSLLVQHQNVQSISFRAYRFDLVQYLKSNNDYNFFPNWNRLEDVGGELAAEWTVALPDTLDFGSHKTFVTPPLKQSGYYYVVASARKDFAASSNRLSFVHLVISDLALLSRTDSAGIEVSVLSGGTGEPISGVDVHLVMYDWKKRHRVFRTEKSKVDGVVNFAKVPQGNHYFLLAQRGAEIAVDPTALRVVSAKEQNEQMRTLLFTDRSIFRPSQTIHWKLVAYKGKFDTGRYATAPATAVQVMLVDPNRQAVSTLQVQTNEFGTASGEFVIPTGRPLGNWTVKSSYGDTLSVRVEEYKRPTFEASLQDSKEPLRLNAVATLTGEARYYFGLPVAQGSVTWKISREPVLPRWWSWWGEEEPFSTAAQIVASGSSSLTEQGLFSVRFTPAADQRLADMRDTSYRYRLTAEVTDEGGETASIERSFRVGFVAIDASINLDVGFVRQGESATVTVLRSSLDGSPREGRGNYRIISLNGPKNTPFPHAVAPPTILAKIDAKKQRFQTPGDRERARWAHGYNTEATLQGWREGSERAKGELKHGSNGVGQLTLPPLDAGAYRIHYETTDEFGEKCEVSKDFLVASDKASLSLPGDLRIERAVVKVGQIGRLFVHSGYAGQRIILDFHRSGKRYKTKILEASKDSSIIEIPIEEGDRGGFAVTARLVRDHQFIFLTSSIYVPWDNAELKIAFSTFRDRLQPGQKETWRVKVTGPAGRDTAVPAAELLAYMYDRSLDVFAAHNPVSPLSLYPSRNSAGWMRANLGQAPNGWLQSQGFGNIPPYNAPSPDHMKFFDSYGIGGPGIRSYSMKAAGGLSRSLSLDGGAYPQAASPMEAESAKVMDSADFVGGDTAAVAENDSAGDKSEVLPVPTASLRSDFSETAFWQPHLITGKDGTSTIEFTVPDSVTSWNVWVHAVTKDFHGGSLKAEAKTVKDLMVRPYLPRFLREGDAADLKVVLNNASDGELSGKLEFDIVDQSTDKSVLQSFGIKNIDANKSFRVAAGQGTTLVFSVTTPPKVGPVAIRVIAKSGDISDGEIRPIPVLPGRMHLLQSRFVTLKDKDRRIMNFADMAKDDDATRIQEQLVVTVDAQLFYSVLSALPYMVNYPYQCTEQTLNRFLSTGILSSLYDKYPAISEMAKDFSKRKSQLESWDEPDPNRKMLLEETPWLQEAKGGAESEKDLVNVLDPRETEAQRLSSLNKLEKMQTASGGFPWFAGGPPSPWMTLYVMHGFSKALEFGVKVPQSMAQKAWNYLHRHYVDDLAKKMVGEDCCWEFVSFLNYVLTNFPDEKWYNGVFVRSERELMLAHSFKHWKQHSPYLKGYLALTLNRMQRPKDAALVWESVMDSAKSAEDQGTFWAPEDRGWLWYNDTIESHAFAIRTTMELTPNDPKLDGLVMWILLNKKMNHWKSTRATSEVLYSLAHYLQMTDQLDQRENLTVNIGPETKKFVFEPKIYTGKKNQVVIAGERLDPKTMSSVEVKKTGRGMAFASATWHFSTEQLPTEGRGDYLGVERRFFKRLTSGQEIVLQPLEDGVEIQVGDEVEVQLSLRSKHPMEYVHLRDPRGAGFEPISAVSKFKWDLGIGWYEEIRDSGTNFFFEHLPQGEYTFKYRLRAATAGVFRVSPAQLQPMYAPEFAAYSAGQVLTVEGE